MIKTDITLQQLKKDLKQIVGKKISRAWKGFGSALFLELGTLHPELGWEKGEKQGISLTGELTLSSEGSWRLLQNDQVILDAEKTASSKIKQIIENFEGLTIQTVNIQENLKSFSFLLSNNTLLEFNKASYGFFTLLSNEKSYISVEQDVPYMHHAML